MNLEFSADELAFRDEVRAFIKAKLPPGLVRANAMTTTAFPEPEVSGPWMSALSARGWLAPAWPAEHGGPGWSVAQRYLFEVECARAGAPIIHPMGVKMVGPVIIGFGSPEQKRTLLPRILACEDYWCQGYSEPGSGSDLASLKTRAVRDGDHYVVNGTKIWTTHAHHANRMFALVRTADTGRKQEGISFLLIDMKTPGITIRPINTIGGEHEVNQVFFDDVRVPVTDRVGDEGQGWVMGKYLLEFERGGGIASARMRLMLQKIERVLAEVSGNGPLDTRTEDEIIEIETDIDAIEMIELRVMNALQVGQNPGAISSLLKLRNSEIRQAITRLGVDAVGAAGLVWEPQRPFYELAEGVVSERVLPVMSAYLNSRAQSIYGGASEIQRDIMAKTMLGL